jgi:hypothetical protein
MKRPALAQEAELAVVWPQDCAAGAQIVHLRVCTLLLNWQSIYFSKRMDD